MQWQGNYFVDTRLPFELRSAPKIFTTVADALQWILSKHGVPLSIHYLDDFLFIEEPGQRSLALQRACNLLTALGVPTAPQKLEGPATTPTFLVIELDTRALTAHLPAVKLQRLLTSLQSWGDCKRCTKQELLSLIGVLQHATAVIRFGRAFLRHMINLSTSVSENHHHIRLDKGFRADLQWWATFAPVWNGQCYLTAARLSQPDEILFSDASGSWGCGGIWGTRWFQLQWLPAWANINIMVKELVPIVLAAALWGHLWEKKIILFRCDNQAVVYCIQCHSSKEELAMQLLTRGNLGSGKNLRHSLPSFSYASILSSAWSKPRPLIQICFWLIPHKSNLC